MAKRVSKAVDPTTDGSGFGAPAMMSGMTFQNLGSLGLRQFSGWVREEFLPQLVGRQAARVYREMYDNSAVIGALMFAIQQAMRGVEWRVTPADESPEAAAAADFADSLRTDMSHTWEQFISEALTMLPYGFAPHEIIYKRRNGRQSNDPSVATSRYDDNLIGWAELPIRGQDTILKWFFDKNGHITGMTQQPWNGAIVDLPIEKLLLFRPMAHKNNPEGRSILRNSYRAYYIQKRMEELEAILFERMSGVPMLKLPGKLLDAASAGNAAALATLNVYKNMVTNIRIDEQMGVILPSDPWMGPNGASAIPMFDFTLVTPQSGRMLVDSQASIERYKLDQLMTTLADFIQLGHGARGVQSLAATKADMFFNGLKGFLDAIESVLNQDGLTRVWRLNGFDPDTQPKYEADLAQRLDLDVLSNFILRLSQSGMSMFPDPDLENWVKDAAGMPDTTDEGDYSSSTAGGEDKNDETTVPAIQKFMDRNGIDRGNVEMVQKVLKGLFAAKILKQRRRKRHKHR